MPVALGLSNKVYEVRARMNDTTARKFAQKIREIFGARILAACAHTIVPPALVAALIFNECGRTRAGDFNERATRFEAHVYAQLVALRDGRRAQAYNQIRRSDLQGMSDAALKNLARSFGATQIMGWSMLKMLPGTIDELRDPDKHLDLTVKRLIICAGRQIAQKDTEATLRIWNTGRANGKTYHADYVPNGLAIQRAYAALPAAAPKIERAQEPMEVVAAIKPGHIITPAADPSGPSNPEAEDLLETVSSAANAKPDTAARMGGGLMRGLMWLVGSFSALSAGGKTLVLFVVVVAVYAAYRHRAQVKQKASMLVSTIIRALKKVTA